MRFEIKNSKGLTIKGEINVASDSKGLAFISHGLGGFKDQLHIKTFAKAFEESGITTVIWDMTNTIGESDGKMEDATITSYYGDLKDVVSWAERQSWYKEPFILCGHSLGGIVSLLFAEKYSEKVKALAPISTLISGKLLRESYPEDLLREWENKGYRLEESNSKKGVLKKIGWGLIKDADNYDVLEDIDKITVPVLLIVGEKDKFLNSQKLLYNKLPSTQKELHIIKGAAHTFYDEDHLSEIETIFKKWISSLNS